MANLHPSFVLEKLLHLFGVQHRVGGSESSEFVEFFNSDIRAIMLCEQILINSVPSALRYNDRPIQILPKAFLEDSASRIVSPSQHHLTNRRTEFRVRYESLPSRLREPTSFEYPLRTPGVFHNSKCSTRCYSSAIPEFTFCS